MTEMLVERSSRRTRLCENLINTDPSKAVGFENIFGSIQDFAVLAHIKSVKRSFYNSSQQSD